MAKNDVIVKITQKQSAGSTGFGVPLIVAGKADEEKKYTEYSSLDEVLEAGFETDSAVYKQCEKLLMQNDRPSSVAVCVGTGTIIETIRSIKDQEFRQVIPILGSGDATLKDVASYIETTDDKMLFVKVADASELSAIGKLDRTMAIVYAGDDEGVEGAVVGATAGLTIGSFTYKNVIIKGITPDSLTDAEIEKIHKAGAITIVKKAGDIVTSEGIVLSGEYADIIDSKDYVIQNIAYKAQKLLNSSSKLPFDNVGISQLESVVTNVLKEAFLMGIIAQDEEGAPLYSTDFATRSEVDPGDRAERNYKGGRFSFELAGAIHYATINGVVEI